MSRTLTAAVLAEIGQKTIWPVLIADLETSGGNVRAWSGIGNLVFGGNTYLGTGNLGTIGPVKESGDEIRANAITFQLSGIPSSLLSTALGTQYQGRPAKLWLGFLDSAGALIADPVLIFDGRMDVMDIDEGPDISTIIVTAESRLADLNRPRIRRYTNEDQEQLFSGDKGLEFVPALQNKEIIWGG